MSDRWNSEGEICWISNTIQRYTLKLDMCDCFDPPSQQQCAVINVPFSSDVGWFRAVFIETLKQGNWIPGEIYPASKFLFYIYIYIYMNRKLLTGAFVFVTVFYIISWVFPSTLVYHNTTIPLKPRVIPNQLTCAPCGVNNPSGLKS